MTAVDASVRQPTVTAYETFLASKLSTVPLIGFEVSPEDLPPSLFPFQRDLTRWALRKGRAAILADTGLGKTLMQLCWAQRAGRRVLILAPLAVTRQTVKEGALWGIPVTYARKQVDAPATGITITNYEMLGHFDASLFDAVVLDESSCLKDFTSKTRTELIETFRQTPMRLCCTATPAPNDISEIANHAEFLGVCTRVEMLSRFFVHDDEGWRLKGHATEAFYRWLASWAMSIKRPSDLGYADDGYILPELEIMPEIVPSSYTPAGQLFITTLKGVGDRAAVRKQTIGVRVDAALRLIAQEPDEQWIVWCGLNDEGREIARRIPGAVLVEGSMAPDEKAAKLAAFADGQSRVLVTKVTIAGMGLNLQRCARMVFVGLSDSWEQYYQAIRRCWRFGQERGVKAHIVLSEPEEPIYWNILRKEKDAERMSQELVGHVATFERAEIGTLAIGGDLTHTQLMVLPSSFRGSNGVTPARVIDQAHGTDWSFYHGDSVRILAGIPAESVDLSVYSPPFSSLYTFSPTEMDLGNCISDEQFFAHYTFIIDQILRATKPGRVTAVHVSDSPAMLSRDGYIGLKDFSGDVIRLYIARGWVFDSRIPIDKNQQAQSIRTHSKGLTMTQMEKDRTWSRPALPDYILKFRKPGENTEPVQNADVTRDLWKEYANPTWPGDGDRAADAGAFATWYGIRESDTLNIAEARGKNDERHIAALQRPTVERCIRLWSNRGDVILSPFGGIGTEGDQAIRWGRRFIGIELKEEYWRVGVKNLQRAESSMHRRDLFSDLVDEAVAP